MKPGGNGEFWTDARIARLKELWPASSARTVADELGCSRNAVIGKAGRLGLQPKAVARPHRPKPPSPPPAWPATPTNCAQGARGEGRGEGSPSPERACPAKPDVRSREAGAGECKWIHGEPPGPDWHYCKAPAAEGSSWCPHHHAIVFVPRSSLDAARGACRWCGGEHPHDRRGCHLRAANRSAA